jgi:hypothetical protein
VGSGNSGARQYGSTAGRCNSIRTSSSTSAGLLRLAGHCRRRADHCWPRVHRRHSGILSFLLGYPRHHVMGHLAVVGGEGVRLSPNACMSAISASESRMQSFLGSLLRNKQLENVLFSRPLGRGAASWRAALMDSGWPAAEAGAAVPPTEFRKLMRSQEATTELPMGSPGVGQHPPNQQCNYRCLWEGV